MKIELGTTRGQRSITITAESENIMEFIHIHDRNGKRLGYLSILNSHSGKTDVDYTEV